MEDIGIGTYRELKGNTDDRKKWRDINELLTNLWIGKKNC